KSLSHCELQQRVETLNHISRVRRLPRWIPSKTLILRLLTRNSLTWARRSVVLHSPWQQISQPGLVDGNGDGRGSLGGSGIPGNGYGVAIRDGRTGAGDGTAAAARGAPQNGKAQYRNDYKADQTPAVQLRQKHNTEQA